MTSGGSNNTTTTTSPHPTDDKPVTAATTTAQQQQQQPTTVPVQQQPPSGAIPFNGVMTPTSPPYPPYVTYIDPEHVDEAGGYTYVYPMSPQFSVQYYQDLNGYQSYPGSPALHPQSPPVNPTSPPFSPTFQPTGAAPGTSITLSPPTHAFVLPSHHHHQFPPLHIPSPVLTGTNHPHHPPGSPPQFIQPLPTLSADQRQKQAQDHFHTHNVYVRGLAATTTDDSFLELCSVYGKITSSKAIIDQKTGECKGYGFAMYESEKECQHAIDGLNKAGLQASFARVGQESFSSRLRSLQDETSTNIYISNLPLDMTEQKLEDLFQPHKTISNRILRDPQSGISRGVGFARLADRHSALTIIEKFNGHAIDGSSAPLQVRFADSPAQKRLKSQTARKRILRPREFQPMASFPVRSMMPVTPETMLGIAPASATAAGVATTAAPQPAYTYYPHDPHHPQYIHYPATLMTTPMPMHAATATAASPHTAPQQQQQPQPQPQDTTALASPPPTTDDKELKELTAAVEQKLDLTKQ